MSAADPFPNRSRSAEVLSENGPENAMEAKPSVAGGARCTCLDQMNEHLRPYGGAVLSSLFSDPPRVFVATTHLESVKRKKKLPLVVATFCPFCGVKVPEDTGPLAKLKESSNTRSA